MTTYPICSLRTRGEHNNRWNRPATVALMGQEDARWRRNRQAVTPAESRTRAVTKARAEAAAAAARAGAARAERRRRNRLRAPERKSRVSQQRQASVEQTREPADGSA